MSGQLDEIVNRLADFLCNWLTARDGFSRRTFYGEAFALLFLHKAGRLTPELRSSLIQSYAAKSKTDPEFHWEFNNYALLRYRVLTHDQTVDQFLHPLRFKHTLSTNWMLLRLVASWLNGADRKQIIDEARRILDQRQKSYGQIWDGKFDRSFQYHAFSLALVGELCLLSGDQSLRDRFAAGLAFIRPFILANGDTLYVGRGQEQCFGYGALAYALALGLAIQNDDSIGLDLRRVINYIAYFQRADGSFPLVFNREEFALNDAPQSPARLPGWYPYNNYFDYLPFFGYMLSKASELIGNPSADAAQSFAPASINSDYAKIIRPSYEAVLSRPGGYWTNDMPFPYVVYKGESLFPCYGSVEYLAKPCRDLAAPYPYHAGLNRSMRSAMFYSKLSRNQLVLCSPFGYLRRQYEFNDNVITVNTHVLAWPGTKNRIVFKRGIRRIGDYDLDDRLFSVHCNLPLVAAGETESASGRLVIFDTDANNTLAILLK